ncbi:3-oxoacyl-[acyl-carrier-protein] synthase 2 [Thalassoglobus neptunius]|uniref:3-oxoacyl-[acyl-carrier-protein] synthase 2 n=1 Tax=Thalassoglobus neptunius TaxID=1938619 RepID=A0A5C5WQH2_9PLAN|nr:beta-ketoacyl-[acyl-carrier-protein] synthase family protein [Thalassoglobus neptunius]TWT52293.1 3-oxoacyl-[acyl-carrier-protein] synthase 2 [Thalassoglobus neptunius]
MKNVHVAVTGIGLVTPLGANRESTWQAILEGGRAGRWLEQDFLKDSVSGGTAASPVFSEIDSANSHARTGRTETQVVHACEQDRATSTTKRFAGFGAPVTADCGAASSPVRATRFAIQAAEEALRHAGLSREIVEKSGCVIGTSKPDLRAFDQFLLHQRLNSLSCCEGDGNSFPNNVGDGTDVEGASQFQNEERTRPSISITDLFPSSPAMAVAQEFGINGGVVCPVAACATGLLSIIQAAQWIQRGEFSCVLAGSTDASLHPGLLGSYRRLGVMARAEDDPAGACRPFDSQRCGFMVGEGAAVVVLEEWESAEKRGAKPLAEWIGGQTGSDPWGITNVDTSGEELGSVIRRLLKEHSVRAEEVGSICYHGTATRFNDLCESRAVRKVFGGQAQLPVGFGVKGSIGHLMGAAGAVETALSLLSLRDGRLPPTANLESIDPECGIPLTMSTAMALPPGLLLKTSLGFGGHLGAGLLKRI